MTSTLPRLPAPLGPLQGSPAPLEPQDSEALGSCCTARTIPRRESPSHEQQLQALLTAVELLSQLASMESSVYQRTLACEHEQVEERDAAGGSLETSSGRIWHCRMDSLQQQWKLEETAVPHLHGGVQRLHGRVLLQQGELDHQALELKALKEQVLDLQEQKRRWIRATNKLQRQRDNLVVELRQTKQERKTLVRAVKAFLQQSQFQDRQQRELVELNQVLRIQAHQRFLVTDNPPRSRTDSHDTHSSDDSLTPSEACSLGTAVTASATSAMLEDDSSFLQDSSLASLSSHVSLVTDDGVPSVKFPVSHGGDAHGVKGSTLPPPRTLLRRPPTTIQAPTPYTLQFARGSKMGLRVRPVELDGSTVAPSPSPRPTSPTPSKAPKGLLSLAVLEDRDDVDMGASGSCNSAPSESLLAPSTHKKDRAEHQNPFSLNLGAFLGGKGHSPTKSSPASPSVPGNPQASSAGIGGETPHVFLVSGYTDGSESSTPARPRPPIGARILAINGRPVGEDWTMAQLLAQLTIGEGDPTSGHLQEFYTVTFRDDPITPKQAAALALPSPHDPPADTSNNPCDIRSEPIVHAATASHSASVIQTASLPGAANDGPPSTAESDLRVDASTLESPTEASSKDLLSALQFSFWSRAAEAYGSSTPNQETAPPTIG